MKKTRADAVIDRLPANQREALDRWLFEEKIAYEKAAERLLQDFNVRSSPSSARRWYQRRQRERALEMISRSNSFADETEQRFASRPENTLAAMTRFVGALAQDSFLHGEPAQVETISDIGELYLRLRSEQRKDAELSLAREKFQFDAAKTCLRELPALKGIASTKWDEGTKLRAVREKLFGILPE